MVKRFLLFSTLLVLLACAAPTPEDPGGNVDYAIVIHGGAGLSSGSLPAAEEERYEEALAILEKGAGSLFDRWSSTTGKIARESAFFSHVGKKVK